jgi:hypothetical protein
MRLATNHQQKVRPNFRPGGFVAKRRPVSGSRAVFRNTTDRKLDISAILGAEIADFPREICDPVCSIEHLCPPGDWGKC